MKKIVIAALIVVIDTAENQIVTGTIYLYRSPKSEFSVFRG